jgi:cobalt-precorrin-5B (C1)-methyltransferase
MMEETSPKNLRRGFTTGTCAAAAAKGATLALATGVVIHRIGITLPDGTPVVLPTKLRSRDEEAAVCSVVKDAGDDPDVTNGAEIVARVIKSSAARKKEGFDILIRGGEGVGRVTKPGLPVAVGEWAINPVPRSMIDCEVKDVLVNFPKVSDGMSFEVVIEVPEGKSLAGKTLNPRLGILGGISILGTTGIVEPISTKAWEDTVAVQIDVARACGSDTVVLTPGRSSEKVAERLFPDLSEEAFIQMGDFVASSLRRCGEKGIQRVIVVAMPGKMAKIAMGFSETHHRASELNFGDLAVWADASGMDRETARRIRGANTVREIAEFLPGDAPLYNELLRRAKHHCETHGEGKIKVDVVLIGYDGEVLVGKT